MLLELRRLLNRTIIPRSLMGRAIMIIVLPIVVLQIILTVIFYNRHWDTATRWLASGVAGEVALLVDLIKLEPDLDDRAAVIDRFRRHVDLAISFEPGGDLVRGARAAGFQPGWLAHIDGKIIEAFESKIHHPFVLDLRPDQPERIAVFVQLEDGLLRVLARRRRVTTTTTWLLASWMVGASTVLTLVALYYMRLQVRPIRRLARAVDSFGKGRDVGDIRPEGPYEVKLAAAAFNVMRRRILRYVGQRTEMLAAVSHDLRTPLTRMKLELELIDPSGEDAGLKELRADVREMGELVEAYLAFASGEGTEAVETTALAPLLQSLRERAERAGAAVEVALDEPLALPVRPQALRRCLANLVDNACRYGGWVGISARRDGAHVAIAIEDDGPGIPSEQRDQVLRAFVRLDQSRSRDTGGVGLGLTIARDIALGHGGELLLGESARGGLRALVRLPV